MADERGDRIVRLATIGVVAWNVCLTARFSYTLFEQGVLNLADGIGSVACLFLSTVLVLRGVRATPDRMSRVLLAPLAVVILGVLPFASPLWAANLGALAGLGLVFLKRPWALLLFAAAITVAVTDSLTYTMPRAFVVDHWQAYEVASFDAVVIAWTGIALAVLVRLARTVRELRAARQQLAARAMVVERQRIDDELAQTIGAALQLIIADGEAAARLAREDPQAAGQVLRALTARSRAALADARSLLTGYRNISPDAELRAAATLLAAAGIDARVTLPDGELPPELPGPLRARLRAEVARALTGGVAGQCVLAVARDPGGQLDIRVTAVQALVGDGAR